MKSTLLLCLLALAASASAQTTRPSLRALDEKNGFRDLRFGADTSDLAGRLFIMTGDRLRYYSRPSDSNAIGDSQVTIYYGFYKGKLAAVGIKAADKTNGSALLAALVATYGMPYRANPYIEDYAWNGSLVQMTLDATDTPTTQVFISSRPILNQMRAEKAGAAQRAKSDL